MITGIGVTSIESERKGGKIDVFNINMSITDVKTEGDTLTMQYMIRVDYGSDAGYIAMKGVAFARENKETITEVKKRWDKEKKLPDAYAENVLNVLTSYGVANATIISKVINFPPPIPMGRIRLGKEKK